MSYDAETSNLIAALDIGTSNTIVLIGELLSDGKLEVIGIGMHESSGMKNGMVVNIDAAVSSIQHALKDAERMAKCKVHKVYASISDKHIRSSRASGMVKIVDKVVSQADIDHVLDNASSISLPCDQQVLHILEQEYSIFGHEGIKNPLGMGVHRLEAEVTIITSEVRTTQNIVECAHRCGLEVSKLIFQPLASSKAVLTDCDKDQGVCLVNTGGGTTDVAIFTGGVLRHTAVIPTAGDKITNDIAMAFHTTTNDAEDIKIKYGCTLRKLNDDSSIETPCVGEYSASMFSRKKLAEIIELRTGELYTLVRAELHKCVDANLLNCGIVITGGGSIMQGILESGEEICQLEVRFGYPRYVGELSDVINKPNFSTAVGLLMYGLEDIGRNTWKISHDAKQDLLFESVKQLVIKSRTPSISLVQRTFRINYSRAASMLKAMEGDVVTTLDERGTRKMLVGETNE